MSIHKVTCQVGTQELEFESGKMGKLADGAVTVRVGDTIVMVTAVSQTNVREGQDWFPLSVEYKEKAAAAGEISRWLFQAGRSPHRKRNSHLPNDGSSASSAFPERIFLRYPGCIALLLSADLGKRCRYSRA